MITIENHALTVIINELGAELWSVRGENGKEYLWQGNPDVWQGRAPVLFPIAGGLKDDEFYFDGKPYTLNKHGYAKFTVFEVEKAEETKAVFLHRSNEETKKSFPFDYEFRVIFELEESTVHVTYSVTNIGNGNMYFSVGAHEAYACEGGIQSYSILFPQNETLGRHVLNGNLLEHTTIPVMDDTNELKLNYDYFDTDALVFKDNKSRSVQLKNNLTGETIKIEFQGFPYFLIWTKRDAEYVCIEPWFGVQDSVDCNKELTQKEGIVQLAASDTFRCLHSFTIESL